MKANGSSKYAVQQADAGPARASPDRPAINRLGKSQTFLVRRCAAACVRIPKTSQKGETCQQSDAFLSPTIRSDRVRSPPLGGKPVLLPRGPRSSGRCVHGPIQPMARSVDESFRRVALGAICQLKSPSNVASSQARSASCPPSGFGAVAISPPPEDTGIRQLSTMGTRCSTAGQALAAHARIDHRSQPHPSAIFVHVAALRLASRHRRRSRRSRGRAIATRTKTTRHSSQPPL